MSAEEKNEALARTFFEEAWGKGDLAAVDEFIAADYVMYPVPQLLDFATSSRFGPPFRGLHFLRF